jgi:hypothetical protein
MNKKTNDLLRSRPGWRERAARLWADYENKVSPSRILTVCKTDTRKLDGRRREQRAMASTATVVSVKATRRIVPKAEPEGAMPLRPSRPIRWRGACQRRPAALT